MKALVKTIAWVNVEAPKAEKAAKAALAWLASGSLEGLLYETRANDPAILGAVAATLVTVGCLATLGPALRATRW